MHDMQKGNMTSEKAKVTSKLKTELKKDVSKIRIK